MRIERGEEVKGEDTKGGKRKVCERREKEKMCLDS